MGDKKYINNALENLPGGFLIYRADYDKEEIIYANQKLIRLFECDDYDDFIKYTHGSFKGIVCEDDRNLVDSQIKLQINSGSNNFDHVQYHIITKKGKVLYVEDFGQYVESEDEGPLFYVYIVDIETKNISYDIDHITGLPGDRRFMEFASNFIAAITKSVNISYFSVAYLNFVGFKNFNLKYGFKAGNKFLLEFAETLNDIFSSGLVARLSDNNFAVLSESEDIDAKLKQLDELIRDKYPKENVILKAGVYVLTDDDFNHFDLALNNAKTACREAQANDINLYKFYDADMKASQELYDYVTSNLETACKNGWIKVFYQPVIRTLTNRLCSAEALARWIDPKYGFLPPFKFIEPLEETRQIHKLDAYMINEICRELRERIDKDLPIVPISFNLSRHDFILTDAFEMVSGACDKYEIPHRLIKIEITETTVIENPATMRKITQRFRDSGFEIWMDDFGSGYSSLNVLKDFDFDEIKLDMTFLSDFSDKAKIIITNSVVMAKNIGVKTLAEGVETPEQYEFLKSIGCERAQGYLFSKPLPFDFMLELMTIKKIEPEQSRIRNFYDEITQINFVTEHPVCLVYDDGKNFDIKFKNKSFDELLTGIGIESKDALVEIMNAPTSVFRRAMRDNQSYFPQTVGREVVFFYTFLGNYIRFQSRNVGMLDNFKMYWIRVDNLTSKEENIQNERFDSSLRNIYHMYDSVATCNIRDNSFKIIVSDQVTDGGITSDVISYTGFVNELKSVILPEDVERYMKFCNPKTLTERINDTENGYIIDAFRFVNKRFEVLWKHVVFISSGVNDDNYLILGRKFTKNETDYIENIVCQTKLNENKSDITLQPIFNTLINYSDRYFFWKDKDRRFLGASKSFLQVYDIKNVNDIIGKTDEDVGWNVTELEYKNREVDVLTKGITIKNVFGTCIIRGVPHNIACTKWPIYENGEIVGLFGYFVDLDEQEELLRNELGFVDSATNVLNNRGFMESLMNYLAESKKLNTPFIMITIQLTRIEEIMHFLGSDIAEASERVAAKELKKRFGLHSSISHVGFGKFVILRSYLENKKANDFCIEIENALSSISDVEGTPLTLYAKAVAVNSLDADNSAEKLISIATIKFNN